MSTFGLASEPYFTDTEFYDTAVHRNTSDQGRADGIRDDYRWLRFQSENAPTTPAAFYPARHSTGVRSMSAATAPLTILGRTSDGFYLCWEVQQETGTTTLDLAELRRKVVESPTGTVEFEGNTLDESMITDLIEADARDDSPIWPVTPCADCGDDSTYEIEGRPLCAGHAAGFGLRESEGGR